MPRKITSVVGLASPKVSFLVKEGVLFNWKKSAFFMNKCASFGLLVCIFLLIEHINCTYILGE